MKEAVTLFCSFCGKSQHEVKTLIAGPKPGSNDASHACICDECACLCVDIIAEEARKGGGDPSVLGAEGLRDSFAGQALASGQASNWRDNDYKPVDGLSIIENTARHAYVIADAMLKARAE